MNKSKKRGFTLVEIIVVIAIIGVLASFLVPVMMGYVKKARKSADRSTAGTFGRIASSALADDDSDYSGSDYEVTVHRGKDEEKYKLTVIGLNDNDKWKAIGGSDELINNFNSDADSTPVKFHGGALPSECWIVGYSNEESQQLEIWVGSKNGKPSYRLWPNPDEMYT